MMKVLVAQKDSRQHYLIPKSLFLSDNLGGFITSTYNFFPKPIDKLASMVNIRALKNFLGRRIDGVPTHLIKMLPYMSVSEVLKKSMGQWYESDNNDNDSMFAEKVAKVSCFEHDIFFGFSYSALEALEKKSKEGIFTVLDHYDAGLREWEIINHALQKNPEYGGTLPKRRVHYFRSHRECKIADLIVVNSEWTKQCLTEKGVENEKIFIIPQSIDLSGMIPRYVPNVNHSRLKVLWLGTVNVRKGIHLLIEAAKSFVGKVDFDVYGKIDVDLRKIFIPSNVTMKGVVSRNCIYDIYPQYDIFILPTLSDGFATVQLEAQKIGLPMIVSTHCGKVVEDEFNGKVMKDITSESLACELEWFLVNRDKIPKMSRNSQQEVKLFSVENYNRRLLEIITAGFK